ncbi:hypothetical protein ACJ73_05862 [Blastomyces percursus]|uniref:Uncharacterized protein n=1 Tax=Blastomyces percursus TaxID=1658174 RepID=A0A1J9Q2J5_9EURO|nr:hypothetical protein ACJ73_05862 [Blastomyces percursus]
MLWQTHPNAGVNIGSRSYAAPRTRRTNGTRRRRIWHLPTYRNRARHLTGFAHTGLPEGFIPRFPQADRHLILAAGSIREVTNTEAPRNFSHPMRHAKDLITKDLHMKANIFIGDLMIAHPQKKVDNITVEPRGNLTSLVIRSTLKKEAPHYPMADLIILPALPAGCLPYDREITAQPPSTRNIEAQVLRPTGQREELILGRRTTVLRKHVMEIDDSTTTQVSTA